MRKTLYPPQQASHDVLLHALQSNESALDTSDTGTGKTLKAVELARSMGKTPFVVCPKVVIDAWEESLEGQGVSYTGVINYEKLRTGNTEWVTKFRRKFTWVLPENSLLIFDEVHKCKSTKSLNAKLLSSAKTQNIPTLLLSATAAEDPREMMSLGYALGLHSLRDFWPWAVRFGVEFGSWGEANFPKGSRPHLEKLNKLIYPSRGHKLTRADLGDHFKKTRVVTEGINFGKRTESLCKDLAAELKVLEDRRKSDRKVDKDGEAIATLAITKILRLRQKIELLKVPIVAEMVKEYVDAGNHVVVFLNFSDSIDALSARLKQPHLFIRGSQTDAERKDAISRFQSDEIPVLIANTSAGGVGVSLHDTHGNYPRVSIISPTYDAKEWAQVLGRIDRVGNETDSVQRVLVASGTIEEKIVATLLEKTENISLLNKQYVLNTPITMAPEKKAKPLDEAHAKFGPSSLKMFKACPGYHNRVSTNEAAEMGTRIHDALETGDWTALSDYENMIAQQCWDGVEFVKKRHSMADAEVFNEIRLHIDLGGDVSTFGTSDVLMVDGSRGVKIDYKTGVSYIPPTDENWQAKAYSVGAFQKFPELETLDFYFLVPRRDEILHHQFKREDVNGMREEIRDIVIAATAVRKQGLEKSVKLLSPTNKVCNYCDKLSVCPAQRAKAIEVASKCVSDEFEIPDLVMGEDIDDPVVLAKLLKLAPILKECMSGWQARANRMAFEEGLELPGFEIAERSGSRKITSALAAYGAIKDTVPVEDFLECLDGIAVTKFEKIIAKASKRGEKKKNVEKVMTDLHDVGAVTRGDDVHFLKQSN